MVKRKKKRTAKKRVTKKPRVSKKRGKTASPFVILVTSTKVPTVRQRKRR